MNANHISEEEARAFSLSSQKTHLRVLSKIQRKQVSAITRDWQKFTYSVHKQMFDKI